MGKGYKIFFGTYKRYDNEDVLIPFIFKVEISSPKFTMKFKNDKTKIESTLITWLGDGLFIDNDEWVIEVRPFDENLMDLKDSYFPLVDESKKLLDSNLELVDMTNNARESAMGLVANPFFDNDACLEAHRYLLQEEDFKLAREDGSFYRCNIPQGPLAINEGSYDICLIEKGGNKFDVFLMRHSGALIYKKAIWGVHDPEINTNSHSEDLDSTFTLLESAVNNDFISGKGRVYTVDETDLRLNLPGAKMETYTHYPSAYLDKKKMIFTSISFPLFSHKNLLTLNIPPLKCGKYDLEASLRNIANVDWDNRYRRPPLRISHW